MDDKTSDGMRKFFQGYAADFDAICGRTKKPNYFGRILDRYFRKVMFQRMQEVLIDSRREKIKTLLDIGCGPGRYAIEFLKQGKDVVALDIAQVMLNMAKIATKGIETGSIKFVNADYLEHNFEQKFDAACLMGFFDYIEFPINVLKKLKKEVSGTIYASFPKSSGLLAWQRKIKHTLRRCPLFLYTRKDVEELIKEAGFEFNYEIKDLGRDHFVKIEIEKLMK